MYLPKGLGGDGGVGVEGRGRDVKGPGVEGDKVVKRAKKL